MWKTSDFKSRRQAIIEYFRSKEVTEDSVTEYCSLVGIPLTVVYKFIMWDIPEHRKLCIRKIEEINSFFGIKEDTCGFCENKCFNEHCITEER